MILKFLSDTAKASFFIRYFGFTKVPLIFYVNPSVVFLDDKKCVIKIPLNRKTKNHLNSMYFGVLATGADIAAGLVAMNEIKESKKKISLSFKDFNADFHKRAEGDVHFVCEDSLGIRDFVAKVIHSGERMNYAVNVKAIVPSISEDVVASFRLTLSLKLIS